MGVGKLGHWGASFVVRAATIAALPPPKAPPVRPVGARTGGRSLCLRSMHACCAGEVQCFASSAHAVIEVGLETGYTAVFGPACESHLTWPTRGRSAPFRNYLIQSLNRAPGHGLTVKKRAIQLGLDHFPNCGGTPEGDGTDGALDCVDIEFDAVVSLLKTLSGEDLPE